MINYDDEWRWMMNDDEWWWMMVTDNKWRWMMIDGEWWWMIMNIVDESQIWRTESTIKLTLEQLNLTMFVTGHHYLLAGKTANDRLFFDRGIPGYISPPGLVAATNV